MPEAHVIYHFEQGDGWWAESPEYPTYAAFGQSRDEVTLLVREGLPFAADDPDLVIIGLEPVAASTTGLDLRRPSFHGWLAAFLPGGRETRGKTAAVADSAHMERCAEARRARETARQAYDEVAQSLVESPPTSIDVLRVCGDWLRARDEALDEYDRSLRAYDAARKDCGCGG